MESGLSRRCDIRAAGAGTLAGFVVCGNPESSGLYSSVDGTITNLSRDSSADGPIEAITTLGQADGEARSDENEQFELSVKWSV